jgi:hypothetical protein
MCFSWINVFNRALASASMTPSAKIVHALPNTSLGIDGGWPLNRILSDGISANAKCATSGAADRESMRAASPTLTSYIAATGLIVTTKSAHLHLNKISATGNTPES